MKIYANGINHTSKKILATSITILLIVLTISPIVNSENVSIPTLSPTDLVGDEKELHLLRGEHYLFMNASEDVDKFHIRFSFPPDYAYQVPILLEIFNDTTEKLLHYEIEDATNKPNKIINFKA